LNGGPPDAGLTAFGYAAGSTAITRPTETRMPLSFSPLFAGLCLAVAAAGLAPGAHAADTPEPTPVRQADTDPLKSARAHLAAQRWQPAIADLKKANASGDADWNNLMGYALRKQSRTPRCASTRRTWARWNIQANWH